jgi:flagellar biosynthesis/type III secretory pathway protein FliH
MENELFLRFRRYTDFSEDEINVILDQLKAMDLDPEVVRQQLEDSYAAGHEDGYELGNDEGRGEGYDEGWNAAIEKVEEKIGGLYV